MDTLTPALNAVEWVGDENGYLKILDQTRLPWEVHVLDCRDLETVWEAIRALRIRGAPAIGVAGAYGLVLGMQSGKDHSLEAFRAQLHTMADRLRECRPTAVNISLYLKRMESRALHLEAGPVEAIRLALLNEAHAILQENQTACTEMARHGATLIQDGFGLITHCNAGGLATAGMGTALGVILQAHRDGKRIHVFSDETRPLLQGARLTTLELMQAGVDVTLICDSAAAQVMSEGRVHAVFVGADRIAGNGDVANKIGTLSLAIAAHAHEVPFYVVAPMSTMDPELPCGDRIPIEERDAAEVTEGMGMRTAPENVQVYNPAFDVTDARYVRAIVTETGILRPPYEASIRKALSA